MVLLTLIWASNFASIKFIFGECPGLHPSQYAAMRFGVASLAMLPWLARGSSEARRGGLEIGAWICLGYFGQAVGLLTTTADKSAFICSLHVIWVAALSGWLKRSFQLRSGVAALLAVAGVACLELAGATAPTIGDLWSLAQPIGFGTGYVRLEQLVEKYPEDAPTISAAKVTVVGLAALSWATIDGGGNPALPLELVTGNPPVLAAFLWMALVTTALSIAVESYAFKFVPATDAAVILASEPLWAAGIAFVALGEQLGPTDWVGGLLVIAACVLNEIGAGSLPQWLTRQITVRQPEVHSEMQPEMQSQVEMHPEMKSHADLQSEMQSQAEMQTEMQSKGEMHPEMQSQVAMQPEMQNQVEIQPEVQVAMKQDAQVEAQAETQVEAQAQVRAEAGAKAGTSGTEETLGRLTSDEA